MYSHIPEYLNPVAFSAGPLSVRWYAIMYVAGFLVVYRLLRYRIHKGEGTYSPDIIKDFLLCAFIGLLIGGRLGYVLWYVPSYFWEHPLAIVSPFDPETGEFTGIFGMSYFGGLTGAGITSWIFAKRNNLRFFQLADFIIPAIPAGYFFGRLGNFLNGELYGKITDHSWGMYFDGVLRHPSQLYESLTEGLLLFFIFWILRNARRMEGLFLPAYLMGYGVVRFAMEFFRARENEVSILSYMTLGQILSMVILLAGLGLCSWRVKKRAIARV